MHSKIPEPAIRRLSRYSRCLEQMEEGGEKVVSSAQLASRCAVNAAQVRKDLTYFGEFGTRGVGYHSVFLKILNEYRPRWYVASIWSIAGPGVHARRGNIYFVVEHSIDCR